VCINFQQLIRQLMTSQTHTRGREGGKKGKFIIHQRILDPPLELIAHLRSVNNVSALNSTLQVCTFRLLGVRIVVRSLQYWSASMKSFRHRMKTSSKCCSSVLIMISLRGTNISARCRGYQYRSMTKPGRFDIDLI